MYIRMFNTSILCARRIMLTIIAVFRRVIGRLVSLNMSHSSVEKNVFIQYKLYSCTAETDDVPFMFIRPVLFDYVSSAIKPEPHSNPIRPCSVKMLEPSHKVSI